MKSRKRRRIVAIDLWVRSRLKNRNSSVSVSFLAPDWRMLRRLVKGMLRRDRPLGIGRNAIKTSAFLCAHRMWF